MITGTDTGVGKTVVTASLAAAYAPAFPNLTVAKPLATGVPRGETGEDALLLGIGAGRPARVYRTWTLPVSPHRAALAEEDYDPSQLERWCRELSGNPLLVEGVGGFQVPLHLGPPARWVADLAAWTQAEVLLVALDRLGVLNHTLLSAAAIERAGLRLRAVILNQGVAPADPSQSTNLEDLRRLLEVPVLPFPALPDLGAGALRAAGGALQRQLSDLGLGPR